MLWSSHYLYLSRWRKSRTLFISARYCVWLFQSVTHNLGLQWLWTMRQKFWILLFNITMVMAWLQRDTVLPQQRMIIVCHPYCQAAWIAHHPLQGKWWILERGTGKCQKIPATFCLTAVREKLHLKRVLENRHITANKRTLTVSGRRQQHAQWWVHWCWSAMPISSAHKVEILSVPRDDIMLDYWIVSHFLPSVVLGRLVVYWVTMNMLISWFLWSGVVMMRLLSPVNGANLCHVFTFSFIIFHSITFPFPHYLDC